MKLSTNILANFVGRIWGAGIGIVMVPQYIKFLGIESYGLVGFYSTLIGSMAILDLGLSTTLNRELSKARAESRPATEVRNLVFTLECVYWAVGLGISVIVVTLAPTIASHWIKAENLPAVSISQAVMLMGGVVAFQWPISLYNGGLMGLERQVTDNVIMIVMTTVRSVGVIVLLWLVSPTIQAFFIWQIVTSFLYVITMRFSLWHYLPKSMLKLQFSKSQLKEIWRFAAGMTGISLVTFFITQIDKVLLSKVLPLTQFAYYTLAFTAASSVGMLITPIAISVFPKLTALVTSSDRVALIKTYHLSSKLVATVVFPVGLVLIFFAPEVLLIWTKNLEIVKNTTLMVRILVAGSVLNGLMYIPYNLLLAHGDTRFTFIQNLIASTLLVPLLFWWVHLYGAVGGALVWLFINIAFISISIPLIHQKFLKGELKTWYINDTIKPLITPLIILINIKIIVRYNPILIPHNIFTLGAISFVVALLSALALSETRLWIKRFILNFK